MKRVQGVLEIGPLVFLYVDICDEIHSYTDHHDVDEDLATIALLGGFWPSGIKTGIACRYLTDYTTTQMFVASSNTQNSQILYGSAWC